MPKKIDGESLISYILRLTQRNGFGSPLDWLDKPLMNAIAKNSLSNIQKKQLLSLAPFPLESSSARLHSRRWVLFQDTNTDLPRVCPLCVKGLGFLKEDWRNIGNLVCENHHIALVDHCQVCGESLEWSLLLFQGTCSNPECNVQLKPTEIKEEITELFIDEICDCLLANLLVNDPFTTVLPCFKRPQINDFNSSVTKGFNLLTNKESFNQLVTLLFDRHNHFSSFPYKYKLYPLVLLEHNLYSKWPFSEWLLELSTVDYKKTSYTTDNRDFIVTVEDAVNLLSISKEQLTLAIPELSKKKVLPGNSRINIAPLLTEN